MVSCSQNVTLVSSMVCFRYAFIALLLVLTIGALGQSSDQRLTFDFPEADTSTLSKVNFWGTLYFIHEMTAKGKVPFLDVKGKFLGFTGDTCDFCAAALEGTVMVKDTKGQITVLNFQSYGDSSVVNCRKCKRFVKSTLDVEKWGSKRWFVSTGYGHGVKGYHLIPFRTVAVDPKLIPYGSVLYIPEARGVPLVLPDGSKVIHDGYFFAGDGGSAIIGNHLDFFIGVSRTNHFKDFVKSMPSEKFHTYLISEASIVKVLQERHMKK